MFTLFFLFLSILISLYNLLQTDRLHQGERARGVRRLDSKYQGGIKRNRRPSDDTTTRRVEGR